MKLNKVKQKLADLKKKETELSLRENALQTFNPLYTAMKIKVKKGVENNKLSLLKEITSSINENLENIDTKEIVKVIQNQTKKIDSGVAKRVLQELSQMTEKLAGLENKTYFDYEEFNNIFLNGIGKIVNFIVDQDELPNETVYKRNAKNKITRVVEKYNDYTIIYNWLYDSQDNLIKVKSSKS